MLLTRLRQDNKSFHLILHRILTIFVLTTHFLMASSYYCGADSLVYSSSAICAASCGSVCQSMDLNPKNAGSCPSGYANFIYDPALDKTFGVTESTMFWSDVVNIAIPKTLSYQTTIQKLLNGKEGWIGIYDPTKSALYNTVQKDRFVYADLLSLGSYTNFENGQPDNAFGGADLNMSNTIPRGEHWVIMGSNGAWRDVGYHNIGGTTIQPRAYGVTQFNGNLECVSYVGQIETTPIDSIVTQYCQGKTPCYVCGDGNSTLSQCLTAADGSTQMCPLHSVKCDAALATPLCPAGGDLNTTRDMCQATPTMVCGDGYSFDPSLDRCIKDVMCDDGGIFNPQKDRCEKSVLLVCDNGFILDSEKNVCYKAVTCLDGGVYHQATQRCEKQPFITCASGYSFNTTAQRCEATPSCDLGSIYNVASDQCEKAITKTCVSPFTYDPMTDQCVVAAQCPTPSILNKTTDQCEYITSTSTCPSGMTFDSVTQQCWQLPTCSGGGLYDPLHNLCTLNASGSVCSAGYSYDINSKSCVASPICSSGTYNGTTKKCEVTPTYSCSDSSYTYNVTTNRCEKSPVCSSGTYNPTYDKCLTPFTPSCDTPNGYTYNVTTNRCEKSPVCSSGTYNGTTNRCESGSGCSTGYTWNSATGQCEQTLTTDPIIGSTVLLSSYNGADIIYPTMYMSSTCVEYPAVRQWTVSGNNCTFTSGRSKYTVAKDNFYYALITYTSTGTQYQFSKSLSAGDVLTFALTGGTTSSYVGMGLAVVINGQFINITNNKPSGSFTWTVPTTGQYDIRISAGGWDNGSSVINTVTTVTVNGYQCQTGTQTVSCVPGKSCNSQGYLCQSINYTNPSCPNQNLDPSTGMCYTNPTCPVSMGWSSSFDSSADMCITGYQKQCASGSYDASLGQCADSASCSNGILDTLSDRCLQSSSAICSSGSQFNGTVCQWDPACLTGGVLNSSLNQCVSTVTYTCASGYSFNTLLSQCTKNSDCGNGNLNSLSDRCEISGSYSCLSSFTLKGTTCTQSPVCSSGTYNSTLDLCQNSVFNMCDGLGFSPDGNQKICSKPASCQGGVLDTQKDVCQSSPSINCGTYTYDGITQKCQSVVSCDNTIFNATLGRCESSVGKDCRSYLWDNTSGICKKDVNCSINPSFSLSSSTMYSPTIKKCTTLTEHHCISGYSYNGLPILSCEAVPVCKDGIYNPDNDQCYLGDKSCPLGKQFLCNKANDGFSYCSDLNCSDILTAGTTTDDTRMGADDKQNNGKLDENGSCSGKVYIFNGKDMRCRPGGIQTGYTDCCKKGDAWLGLTQCNEIEKALGKYRNLGQMDGKCHFIGSYCASKVLGSCVQDKKTFCCFSGLLARIISEQGREQLGIEWGSPKSPNCRGFTPDEFQKLDLSKMDLSEFTNDIKNKAVESATKNLTPAINAEISRFQGTTNH